MRARPTGDAWPERTARRRRRHGARAPADLGRSAPGSWARRRDIDAVPTHATVFRVRACIPGARRSSSVRLGRGARADASRRRRLARDLQRVLQRRAGHVARGREPRRRSHSLLDWFLRWSRRRMVARRCVPAGPCHDPHGCQFLRYPLVGIKQVPLPAPVRHGCLDDCPSCTRQRTAHSHSGSCGNRNVYRGVLTA